MATRTAIDAASKRFLRVYGKALCAEGIEEWYKVFREVTEEHWEEAINYLVEHRDKATMVVPGEVALAIRAIGGYVRGFSSTPDFDRNPSTRAIRSHDEAGIDEEPVTMSSWLTNEGAGGFGKMMEGYVGRETPADRIQALCGMPTSLQTKEMRPEMRSRGKEAK